ncbi:MAG: type I DNA topoisomerase [Clostridiales bacterium]|jgi:DNA topoisomerase-1|nr:type I DNA topoisomerase [Clostridiales bacterium]HPO53168.1 type I DNA topoisomerase [Clostridia bacterium]
MKLVIVESPSKAKTIQKYLGGSYRVMASGGHICDLPEKTLGVDIENNFKPEYVINPTKKELIKKLKQTVKESEEVYLATDPDREGEAISWHLANTLGLPDAENRIEFNEISSKAVLQAISRPRKINLHLVDAQQARRVLDRLVGYKISPILSRKIKTGLSGGRVQSAALKMLVDREREINAFVPEEYWNINASLLKAGTKAPVIKAALHDKDGKKIKISTEAEANAVLDDIRGGAWKIESVKRGVSKSHPPAPFMTSTLQQDASQKLGLSAPQVMQIAQQLYEGIEIEGEGQTAFITYIRTDSVRVSADIQQATLGFIKDKFGPEYAPQKPNIFATKTQNAQDAHECIRPISLDRTPESVKDKLQRNQYRLYKLIYDRFIASQMTDAEYNTLAVRIEAGAKSGAKYGFSFSGKTLVFKGYTIAYEAEKSEEEETGANLPNLTEGEELSLKDIKSEQKFTKPPTRYTEAGLIKAMEENGIGRPSTYASVISVLAKREYTVKEQKFLKPTQLGETVTEFMETFFKKIVDCKFTADMEKQLDEIEHGVEWQKIIADFYPAFLKDIMKAAKDEKKLALPEVVSDVICEKCGANMVVKEGRFGKFLACPNYPRCKNVKSIVESVGKCPICTGNITKLHSKTGKLFYGCSNYPECKFMSWELPAPILCPKCGSSMRVVENKGKKQYVCNNRSCKNVVIPANEAQKESDVES